jgi:hypothetical protein
VTNWLEGLLEPLLDRLALKLALKVRAQLDGAIDAALDRAEDRIDTAIEGLEERLLAAATKPIADLKVTLAPVITLQQQVVDAEKLRGEVWSKAAEVQQQAIEKAANRAGMITATEIKAQIGFAASSARAAAADHLRSRLTPPRPWKEIPDR